MVVYFKVLILIARFMVHFEVSENIFINLFEMVSRSFDSKNMFLFWRIFITKIFFSFLKERERMCVWEIKRERECVYEREMRVI